MARAEAGTKTNSDDGYEGEDHDSVYATTTRTSPVNGSGSNLAIVEQIPVKLDVAAAV